MSRVSNETGLPEAIVRAIENDSYDRGCADFSVTQLLNPPRLEALKVKHSEEIVEDASTRIFSLLGQATHTILERAARPEVDMVEKRFFAKFGDHVLSGQIDLLEADTGTLSDFKVTKAYAFSKRGGSGQKYEWICQMNMQLELLRQNGLDARKLQIVGILRDWDSGCLDPANKRKFMIGYPKAEIVAAEIPMWPRKQTQELILERVLAHAKAKDDLPLCNIEETWQGRRCFGYCQVSAFCEQYQNSKKTGILNEKE